MSAPLAEALFLFLADKQACLCQLPGELQAALKPRQMCTCLPKPMSSPSAPELWRDALHSSIDSIQAAHHPLIA